MDTCGKQNTISRGDDRVDYKALVSIISESVFILQENKIVYANPAFYSLIGKNSHEVMDGSFADLVALSHKDAVLEFIKTVGQEGDKKNKIEFVLDGTPGKLVVMKLGFFQYCDQNTLLGRMIDITEKRKRKLEIQRLYIRLQSVLDSIHHVVISFSFNETTDESRLNNSTFYDAHLVEINSAAEVLYGVSREAFLEKTRSIFEFVHEEDREKVLRHYNNLHIKGAGKLTYRIIRSDHKIRWVQDYGKVEYQKKNKGVRRINRIIEDITKKKKALDELKVNEKKYRKIFERSKDMIYVVDHVGRFIDINPAGLDLLGLYSKVEAASRNIKEFYVDQKAWHALQKELMENGETFKNRVMLWKSRGEIIEVDLNAIAKIDGSRKMISYQGIVTNITEALRQRELESIAQLAGCFADDLASPLNAIMLSLDVTEELLKEFSGNIDKIPNSEEVSTMIETEKKVETQIKELIDFNKSAKAACKDIAARLREIREEYWRLNKVPDGAGGTIYERWSKRIPKNL